MGGAVDAPPQYWRSPPQGHKDLFRNADIITLVLGVPLVLLAKFTTKGDFFKQKPIAYTEIGE